MWRKSIQVYKAASAEQIFPSTLQHYGPFLLQNLFLIRILYAKEFNCPLPAHFHVKGSWKLVSMKLWNLISFRSDWYMYYLNCFKPVKSIWKIWRNWLSLLFYFHYSYFPCVTNDTSIFPIGMILQDSYYYDFFPCLHYFVYTYYCLDCKALQRNYVFS